MARLRVSVLGLMHIAFAATIPLLILLVNLQLAREFDRSRMLALEVSRSHSARAQLDAILTAHHEMEASQRGLILTGNPDFLARYEADRAGFDATLREYLRLARPHAEPRAAVGAVAALSRQRLDYMGEVVAHFRQGRTNAARTLVGSGEGQRLLDALRARVAELDAAEQVALQRYTAWAEQTRRDAQQTTFALQTLLVLLLLAAAWVIARNMTSEREAAARYRELSARQEAIFDSARDGMLIHDEDGVIEFANPAATRIYGYAREELVGREVGLLFETPPSREEVQQFLKRLTTRRKEEMGRVTEFAGKRRDGRTFPADVATSPVMIGDKLRFLAVIRDTSDRKAMEQVKSDFVSTVSHELRTPLTSIGGSLALLAGGAGGELPKRAARLIEIARNNCERLVRLINDILDIEKLQAGKMPLDLRHLALGPLLEQAAQANRPYAMSFGVPLVLEPVPEDAWVTADPDRMIQVLTNLISNAVKYSPAGEPVTISASAQGGEHRIKVSDRGPGVPPEFADRIFDRFAQADTSDTRQKGGTGLGLAIAREIVQRHQGRIGFYSAPGAGTTFHVDLPVAQRGDAPAPERRRQVTADGGERLQILHVDGDPDMLRVVADAFEGRGAVHSTPSVQEAKAGLERRRFDVAILETAMADGSGLELLPLLQDSRTPTVLFTAQDAPELAGQADAVLTKSRERLDALVDKVLLLAVFGRPSRHAKEAAE